MLVPVRGAGVDRGGLQGGLGGGRGVVLADGDAAGELAERAAHLGHHQVPGDEADPGVHRVEHVGAGGGKGHAVDDAQRGDCLGGLLDGGVLGVGHGVGPLGTACGGRFVMVCQHVGGAIA